MLSNSYHAACRYGQDAKAIAKAVREGVKQVYWVADGAEGVKGWKVSTTCSSRRPSSQLLSLTISTEDAICFMACNFSLTGIHRLGKQKSACCCKSGIVIDCC